ncbi:MAG: hypothetical protein ACI9NQ_001840 [Paracoccaceae bacterium]|jgi:hypothetical protein
MSTRPVIITPSLIRRHNFCCVGRMILWALGSSAVFLIIFLFVWVLAKMFTGIDALTLPVVVGGFVFGIAVYVAGYVHLKRNGPQDWERIAQKPDRRPGMRLARMSNQEYGQMGQGFVGLILAGPGWLTRIREEVRAVIAAPTEVSERLENLRRHFAARDAWVPMRDFSTHEDDIYRLVKLEMLSIRELVGEWHLHVTVQGTVMRIVAGEVEA